MLDISTVTRQFINCQLLYLFDVEFSRKKTCKMFQYLLLNVDFPFPHRLRSVHISSKIVVNLGAVICGVVSDAWIRKTRMLLCGTILMLIGCVFAGLCDVKELTALSIHVCQV